MKGVNKVILVGCLGNDPETRSFPDGGSITNISVATSESWKDKQTGEKKESTEWHRVVFNGRLAEIAAQYLHKASKVYIEGKNKTRKWTDKQGVERYTTEIAAREMQMLDSKSDGQQQMNANQASQAALQPQQQSQQAPQQAQGFDDFSDDIPF